MPESMIVTTLHLMVELNSLWSLSIFKSFGPKLTCCKDTYERGGKDLTDWTDCLLNLYWKIVTAMPPNNINKSLTCCYKFVLIYLKHWYSILTPCSSYCSWYNCPPPLPDNSKLFSMAILSSCVRLGILLMFPPATRVAKWCFGIL